jgi:protease PrsW
VLFWLAILMRYQWVSRLSGIVLAGLAGAAFAFTENILYYGRVYRYAARTFGEVPPLEALQNLFVMRGVITCFGHPLFTAMIGVGLAIALRSKSKIVRVVAPLAGYGVAVFLHMAFNTTASLLQGSSLLFIYLGVALPLVIGMIIFVVRQLFREGRLIRERLVDYVRLGWLPETDPPAMSRLRTRLRALWHAVFTGPETFLATIRMQRAITELAYLRDAVTRGIIDETGRIREKELLAKISSIRGKAIIHPEGRAPYPSLQRRRSGALAGYPPPSYPGPAGLGGNYPAPNAFPAPTGPPQAVPAAASAPLGHSATQYSEVDPTWKPPGE